tara:strand:+ start:7467 stop:8927 length:1461 start_codon:yes stop_codon:yes gene_type:complete
VITPGNTILILSDNHTRRALGCYGHPFVQSPNIDGLAKRGAIFTNAYAASPLCGPSRAAIATGRFPHQSGFWDNVLVYDGSVPSWMHRLRDQGHPVTSIGKLHYRSSDDDNGMTEEIIPMHIVDGQGQVSALLRWCGQEPSMNAQRAVYLYESGEGLSDYGEYDEVILAKTLAWLEENAQENVPWTLIVSFACPHPPFKTPKRLLDIYSVADMPLPAQMAEEEHPLHPALQTLRESKNYRDMWDPDSIRKITASYFALISMVDEKIGAVLAAAEQAGVMSSTRVIYTSDHGESLGAHGLFGKSCLYEEAIGVPLIMAGPDIPKNMTVDIPVSHVDLYPTLVESCGAQLTGEDSDLLGRSLFTTIAGTTENRPVFAEYHATGSKSGAFMLRDGAMKLIYHVGMSPQIFDLAVDPAEQNDLSLTPDGKMILARLEAELRKFCNPEEVDRHAKRDQESRAAEVGGTEEILKAGVFKRSPVPGRDADYSV